MLPSQMNTQVKETFWIIGRKYDVTKAKKLIGSREANATVDVEQAKSLFPIINIKVKKAMRDDVDLRVPVILITVTGEDGELCLPIDGWHRLYKASKKNVAELPAHKLSLEETKEVQLA